MSDDAGALELDLSLLQKLFVFSSHYFRLEQMCLLIQEMRLHRVKGRATEPRDKFYPSYFDLYSVVRTNASRRPRLAGGASLA